MLNTIAELISISIQRTRVQDAYHIKPPPGEGAFDEIIERVLQNRITEIATNLQRANSLLEQKKIPDAQKIIQQTLEHVKALQQQLFLIDRERGENRQDTVKAKRFHYPTSPLTNRELEVLTLYRHGL